MYYKNKISAQVAFKKCLKKNRKKKKKKHFTKYMLQNYLYTFWFAKLY